MVLVENNQLQTKQDAYETPAGQLLDASRTPARGLHDGQLEKIKWAGRAQTM